MGGHGFLLSVSFPDTTSPKIGGQKDEAIDREDTVGLLSNFV